MHNRIKALIVAAMVVTNTLSPTLEVLANEIEIEKANEEITTTVNTEEKTEDSSNVVAKGIKKLEIKPNQGSFDWGYNTTNEIAILVEFDNMANKKVVEIELEEGMAFDKYPVLESPSNEIEYEGTYEEKAIIANVLERPNKDSITNQYSGKLSYEINSNATVANIVIRVSVDRYKYYGEKEIKDAIKVTVKEDDIEQDSKSIDVQAVNNTSLGEKNNSLNTDSTGRTIQVQRGDNGTTYSYFRNTTSKVQTDNNGIKSFTYIKNAIFTMYYPEHTTFVGVNNLPNDATYENYPSENKVIIKMQNPTITNSNISLTYNVDSTAPYGTIESKNRNTMEVEYYDGEKQTLTADKVDSVQVVDPSTLGSVIEMSAQNGCYHDYNGNSLSIGGYIYLDRMTLIEYTNQVFEYNFSNWNTRKVLLPYGMTDVINIKYKLFGDPIEYDVDISQLNNFGGVNRLIDADKLGIPENQYFEKVTFEVKAIPQNFEHTNKGRYNEHAISFGELPNGVDIGSIVIKIYNKDNQNRAKEIKREVNRGIKPESIAITSGGTSVTKNSGDSTTDKSYKAKTIFDANKGFNRLSELSNYLENPEIIIRMPQGFNLSKTSIKLIQNSVKKNFTMTEHISKVDGATIYTLKTNDVKIGGFDPVTLSVNPSLNIEFDFDVDSNIGGKFNINDMIFIGKEDANIDKYYTSADIVVTADEFDLIPGENRSLGRSESKTFDIIKTSDLIITTHVRDNGSDIDKKPYDKTDDENTAIQITKDSLIDFIVRIENNTLKAAKEVEVYIPIPKKGVNMGSKVQPEEFTWDMELHGDAKVVAKDKDGKEIDANNLFEISYGSSKDGNGLYSNTYSPDKDVIKIIPKNDIESGVVGEIKFTFKASDNLQQSDVGSLNVFNAFYTRKYDSGSEVMQKGNNVGFKLSTGKVEGIAFLDKDKDGLYKDWIDTVLKDIEVELWNKATNSLILTTVTDSNGEYKFEGLAKGEYEVRVKNNGNAVDTTASDAKRFTKLTTLSGDSYKNDSDIVSTDNINGSISISMPTNSHLNDINDYVNIGFVEPAKITIKTDGNGKVEGYDSKIYKVWPFTTMKDPGTVTPNIGYRFVNYTDNTGTVFNFPSEVSSDVTIQANFEKIIYKVILDSNGGINGTILEKEISFDNLIKDTLDSLTGDELPTREGYTLVGWSKNPDGTGLITDTDRIGASAITLYAVWDKAPEITGVTDITITVRHDFDLLDGITASDKEDQHVKIEVDAGDFKADVPGRYEIVYKVRDSVGNVTEVIRVVTVDGAPVITGATDKIIKLGSTFNPMDGVDAIDTEDGNLRGSIVVGGDTVDVNTPGKYKVTYTVKDKLGNVTEVARVITVDGLPIITGATDKIIKLGSTFDPMDGVDAIDTEDGNLRGSVIVGGDTVDVNRPGKYKVIYTVEDSAGNIITVNRLVIVYGIPVITGTDDIAIKVNDTFDELDGVIAKDTEGKELNVSVSRNLDISTPGKYILTYEATDEAGNVITLTRVVTVYGAPVITGATDIILKLNATSEFNPLDGVVAKDTEGKELSISVSGDVVDVNTPGRYTVIYTVIDDVGNITTLNRIVIIEEMESSSESDKLVDTKDEVNGEINSDILNTGDKGIIAYLLVAFASMIGLSKNTKGKKE